jgi:hypothetical protein
MDSRKLPWWRAPAWLDGDDVCFDAATAQEYDAAQLGPEVLFDLATVTNAREAAAFVGGYGFLFHPRGPCEPTSGILERADILRLQLSVLEGMQRSVTPEARAAFLPENAQESLHSLAATLLAPPAHPLDQTLAGIIRQRYDGLSTYRVLLGRCPTCGRFFAMQSRGPRARYCRPACAATAAKWRERRSEALTR